MTGTERAQEALAGKRVLIVEDTAIVASEIERVLRNARCEVVGTACNLATALEVARSDVPLDGALLDINLGGPNAYGVADALEARGVPYVFLTGYAHQSLPERYRARPCLEKPFGARQLEEVMTKAFAKGAMGNGQ